MSNYISVRTGRAEYEVADVLRLHLASLEQFLFPIVALSADYRARFCAGLGRLFERGGLKLVGPCVGLDMMGLLDEMQHKAWAVHINGFAGPEGVYDYLSRYVHQVAISNYRIIEVADGWVSFSYKDNKAKDPLTGQAQEKELRLRAVEFIRRFLWHVLPAGFVHIRHYGLHHSSARKEKLPRCRELLGLEPELPEGRELGLREWLETFIEIAELDRCPACGAQQTMTRQRDFAEVSWLGLIFLSLFGLKGYQVVWL